MLDVNALLNEVGAKLVNDLKNDIKNKTITKYGAVNASGDLLNSIKYEVDGLTLRVTGNSYIYYLQFGRKNGRRPPYDKDSTKFGVKKFGKNKGKPRGDYPNISEWIENKPSAQANFGWNQLRDYEKKSIVYLIARKIGEKGTTIFEQGGSDLVSAVISRDIVKFIESKLLEGFRTETVNSFRSQVISLAA
jgi:hypothetical protein